MPHLKRAVSPQTSLLSVLSLLCLRVLLLHHAHILAHVLGRVLLHKEQGLVTTELTETNSVTTTMFRVHTDLESEKKMSGKWKFISEIIYRILEVREINSGWHKSLEFWHVVLRKVCNNVFKFILVFIIESSNYKLPWDFNLDLLYKNTPTNI